MSRILALCLAAIFPAAVRGDAVSYLASPASYPEVTFGLEQEFGTSNFPPLQEAQLSHYQVQGSGPVDLTFRFHNDTGSFLFSFGFYHTSAALNSIDLSTDAGKISYASQALTAGNATVVFDDASDNPGITATHTLNGGNIIGFFMIPDETLASFQSNPSAFALDGVGSVRLGIGGPLRWPLFSVADANPGGFDQLLSFNGTSVATGNPSNMIAWEDLTRIALSDNQFNDLVFGIEGFVPSAAVPEPSAFMFLGLAAGCTLGLRTLVKRVFHHIWF